METNENHQLREQVSALSAEALRQADEIANLRAALKGRQEVIGGLMMEKAKAAVGGSIGNDPAFREALANYRNAKDVRAKQVREDLTAYLDSLLAGSKAGNPAQDGLVFPPSRARQRDADLAIIRNLDRIGMILGAALAGMHSDTIKGVDYLRRDGVMDLVMAWRAAWDLNSAERKPVVREQTRSALASADAPLQPMRAPIPDDSNLDYIRGRLLCAATFDDSITFNRVSAGALLDAITPAAVSVAEPASQQDAGGVPLTEAQIARGARRMADNSAEVCNVDKDDNWKVYGNEFIDEFKGLVECALAAPVSPTPSATTGEQP